MTRFSALAIVGLMALTGSIAGTASSASAADQVGNIDLEIRVTESRDPVSTAPVTTSVLPVTGGDNEPWFLVGIGLSTFGGLVVARSLASKRRRKAA
ncbi:hypothetical protein BH09ACT3_BH09ACT3_02090 [soil metagenome]